MELCEEVRITWQKFSFLRDVRTDSISVKGKFMMDHKIAQWIKTNPNIFQKIVATAFFIFGILLMVGAVKNWDCLYAPDKEYHSKSSMGQLSRYFGRKTARIVGFIGGGVILAFGSVLLYSAFLSH